MHNTDKMKLSELRKIIQEAIKETISEADIDPATKAAKDAEMKAIDAKIKALQTKKGDLSSGREDVAEGELDELANVAVRYELSPEADTAGITGKKSRIIGAMQATNEPMSKIEVATALGYDKQNPINADFMALVANGVIVPSTEQAAPRLARAAAEPGGEEGEEQPPAEDEFGLTGREEMSDEEIDAMFAAAKASGEEEPEATDIETTDTGKVSMSDEDYEDFMKYSDISDRLAKVKSDILKLKRFKKDAGDISDKPNDEVQRLVALKSKLQQRLDDLVAGSAYLQKRQGKSTETPEEIESEETLDEWTKNNWQYYAGIKK